MTSTHFQTITLAYPSQLERSYTSSAPYPSFRSYPGSGSRLRTGYSAFQGPGRRLGTGASVKAYHESSTSQEPQSVSSRSRVQKRQADSYISDTSNRLPSLPHTAKSCGRSRADASKRSLSSTSLADRSTFRSSYHHATNYGDRRRSHTTTPGSQSYPLSSLSPTCTSYRTRGKTTNRGRRQSRKSTGESCGSLWSQKYGSGHTLGASIPPTNHWSLQSERSNSSTASISSSSKEALLEATSSPITVVETMTPAAEWGRRWEEMMKRKGNANGTGVSCGGSSAGIGMFARPVCA